EMNPCSLVSECGVCECESGVEARVVRAAFLAQQLAHADVVLAPSAIARDVLVANGLDPARVRVNENGLPRDQLAGLSRRTQQDGDIRFLFAGTGQPMKGADVLASALRLLGEMPGVQLDLVAPTPEQLVGMPSWVSARERYLPEDLNDVLAHYDVLLLPSVMRESHSILTREALTAGLAVLCTDTLGPEEAVKHEYNGLIVPAGDPDSLADAIRRLVENPSFARSLAGQGSVSPVRELADQVADNLGLYRALGDTSPSYAGTREVLRAAQRSLLTDVLFVTGIQGAPLRYRVHLAAEALSHVGVGSRVLHYRSPDLPEAAATASAVVFYRVPATIQVLSVIDQIKEQRPYSPVLFDIDDLIFDPSLRGSVAGLEGMPAEEEDLWWRGVARYRTTLEACDGYVGSTNLLTKRAESLTGLPSYRFANGVGKLLAQRSDQEVRRPRKPGPLRVGYFSGTTMHDADWAHIEAGVAEILERHPTVELVLGGHLKVTPALEPFGDRVQRVPFMHWSDLPAVLRDTDICLAPLASKNEFNEAKSAIKGWIVFVLPM
ncbi:MAG TPA: glycosyltransferase, partial [Brevibacterium sp.]|nr:glycosyltransferase [Brevibacterium sp.]